MTIPPAVTQAGQNIAKSIHFTLPGGQIISPSYLQVGIIIFLLFLLVLMMGQLRHRMVHWEMKGILPGVAFGFALALIFEGFALIGGRTLLTETLGWKTAPKPIANVLDAGRNQFIKVLGITEEIPTSMAQEPCTLPEE